MLILGHFWCSLVTSVIFSSNLGNFKKLSKKSQILFKKKLQIPKRIKKHIFFLNLTKIQIKKTLNLEKKIITKTQKKSQKIQNSQGFFSFILLYLFFYFYFFFKYCLIGKEKNHHSFSLFGICNSTSQTLRKISGRI